MSNRQRTAGVRLAIDFEAEALLAMSGGEAYRVARRRAEEASSEDLAKDWTGVAGLIARKTGKTPVPARHDVPLGRESGEPVSTIGATNFRHPRA